MPRRYRIEATTLHELKRFEEALASYDGALALKPDLADAYNGMGNMLKVLGRVAGSAKGLSRSTPAQSKHRWRLFQPCRVENLQAPTILILRQWKSLAAKTKDYRKIDRVQLDFALGKAYADLKDYRRSFKHLLAGNVGNARRSTTTRNPHSPYSTASRRSLPRIDRCKVGRRRSLGYADLRARHAAFRNNAGRADHRKSSDGVRRRRIARPSTTPFLPPADGTATQIPFPEFVPALDPSALRQIGARYVAAVRELIPKGKAAQAERVTDKMPSNYYFVGLIHLALPNAKIIHSIRDPLDTCISCSPNCSPGNKIIPTTWVSSAGYYKRYDN